MMMMRRRGASAPGTPPILLLISLLALIIMTDCPGYGGSSQRSGHGGGGGWKGSSSVFGVLHADAAATPKPSADAQLRAAVTRSRRTVLRLTSDVSLTADLPTVTCPDLTVIGRCRTRSGRWRRCKIDGRKRFSGFRAFGYNLTLDGLEITGFVSRSGKDNSFLQSIGRPIIIRNCVFINNRASLISYTTGDSLKVSGSSFVGNKGDLIMVGYSSMEGTDLVFRGNEGGTAISLGRAGLTCSRCAFENNTSESAPVVVSTSSNGGFIFSDSRFVGNRLEKAGSQGAVARMYTGSGIFCNCTFSGNVARLPGGGWRTDNVYAEADLIFCKQRPSAGIFGQPVDDCTRCTA